jgi:signal transduction histidine kinase
LAVPDQTAQGHGLLGMSERVALYGGELHAGPGRSGGFEVRARIPLDVTSASQERVPPARQTDPAAAPPPDRLRWRWLDPALAAAVLVELEVAVMTSSPSRGPLILNMIVVAAMALVTAWRRHRPVLFCVTIWVLSWVMNNALTSLNSSALPKGFLFIAPLYTLAAWTNRRTAVAGLALVLLSAVFNYLFGHAGYNVTDYAGVVFVFLAAWAVGRAFRARRLLVADLKRTSARLAAEQEDRERLSIAGERSRIAREVHSLVARSVAAMVVQTAAAQGLLDSEPERADTAMDAIEGTGRQALGEMRRTLGILRDGSGSDQRAPQPGIDQIYALIQRARQQGQAVEMSVDGDPGTLPAGVELGLYRILEEALQTARQDRESPMTVTFSFGREELVELRLASSCARLNHWPTRGMLERVALCDGRLNLDGDDNGGWRLVARIPRVTQAVLV